MNPLIDKLMEYVNHSDRCILSDCSAGRPTEDGGYENKYRGVWYQSRPIDKTPKCDCGLDEILKNLRAEDWSEYVKVSDVVAAIDKLKESRTFGDSIAREERMYWLGLDDAIASLPRPQGEEH